MGEPHVVSALRDKRSELSGLIEHLERQINQHRASLVHVDGVIRLYEPTMVPETEIPVKRVRERNNWFRTGECVRLVCDLLRDAPEPMITSSIVSSIMEMKGIPAGDDRNHELLQKSVLGALGRAPKLFERSSKDGGTYWRIRPQAAQDRCQ